MPESLFLLKLLASDLQLYLLKETLAPVLYYEFCKILQNAFFNRTPPVAALSEVAGHRCSTEMLF